MQNSFKGFIVMIKVSLYILRECLVNLVGYKMGLRGVLGRGKMLNVTGNLSKDINDKGVKHRLNVEKILGDLDLRPQKRRFLEMGPGGLLLHGCMVVLDDWDEYIAVDAFTSDVWSDYPISVLKAYSETLSGDEKEKIDEVIMMRDKNPYVKYYGVDGVFNEDFNASVGSGDVDVIYSWGVFEHIEDISSVFEKNYDLLAHDGVAIHVIDTHPHTWLRFSNPYVFLWVPDWLWNIIYGGRGFITRRMPSEYISEAENVGFNVAVHSREVADYDIGDLKKRFISRFRRFQDEEILTQRIYMIMKK